MTSDIVQFASETWIDLPLEAEVPAISGGHLKVGIYDESFEGVAISDGRRGSQISGKLDGRDGEGISPFSLERIGVELGLEGRVGLGVAEEEPRIGFAYDINGDGKTAIRGDYGILEARDSDIEAVTEEETRKGVILNTKPTERLRREQLLLRSRWPLTENPPSLTRSIRRS